MKTWRRHWCLNKLKVTRHYWVLSKTKLFYGWVILLLFILFKKEKKKEENLLFVIYIMEYWISVIRHDASRHQSEYFLKKLNLAHKWINCCNKSINVGVYCRNSLHHLFQLFCGLFSFTLHVFISTSVLSFYHAQTNLKPRRTTECSTMFRFYFCSNRWPGSSQFCFDVKKKKRQKPGMVSNLLFLSSINHIQALHHVQSHLEHFYTSFTLFSD